MKIFRNRQDAGEKLAKRLLKIYLRNPLILALPRGGVPLGAIIASKLKAPLDLLMVKKIGLPNQEELAIGAVSEDGVVVYNKEILKLTHLPKQTVEILTEDAVKTLQKKAEKFRRFQRPHSVEGKDVVVVDDGLATGQTVLAVLKLLKKRGARKIIVAAPVAPIATVHKIEKLADEVVILNPEEFFYAVGEFYSDFSEVTDEDVIDCIRGLRNGLSKKPSQRQPQESRY